MKKSKQQKRIYLPALSDIHPLTAKERAVFTVAAARRRKRGFSGLVFRAICNCYRGENCYTVIQRIVDIGRALSPAEKRAFRIAAKRKKQGEK
jgi:hypothetical protein